MNKIIPNQYYSLISQSKWFVIIITSLIFTANTDAQLITIKGVIIDENKIPLVEVNIILNERKYGTVSDFKGEFFFKDIPQKTYQLQVSSVGYETSFYTIASDTSTLFLNIQLKLQYNCWMKSKSKAIRKKS